VTALCRHFGTCGGCAHQDMPDEAYRILKRDAVVRALARQGLGETEVSDVIEVAPGTRRRCVFKIARRGGEVLVGFHARAAHSIVDMRECRVLTPELFAMAARVRAAMGQILGDGEAAELHATDTDNGFDLAFRWKRKPSPALTATLAQWAGQASVARITAGNDVLVELAPPMIRIGKAAVRLPPHAFLQPTREGEAFLQQEVCAALSGARAVADLFAGCGTFALTLAGQTKVHAVELDGAMLDALVAAARGTKGLKPVSGEKRDLFKRPLLARELDAYDGVSLDPPRAGAEAQIAQIAQSKIRRIAYVSCNAGTFARDARILVDAGFTMNAVIPVDQFLWSEHIELVASFRR
jgi:23S rRNA (uracil1939-C5)-methyltransferase